MPRLSQRSNTIRKKLLLPVAAVLILQAGLFSATLLWGGTIDQLNQNAMDILSERVSNRRNDLQVEMYQRWTNLSSAVDSVQEITSRTLRAEGINASELRGNTPLANQILLQSANTLIYTMRRNSVTGAFLILDGEDATLSRGQSVRKSGLYLRDMDPASNPDNNADLLLECAPVSVARSLNISLDSNWRGQVRFSGDEPENSAYYYKPFQASVEYPEIGWKNLGYWSLPFRLSETDIPVITYSVPLRDVQGHTYGVLGVELSLDYLRSRMPYDELSLGKKGAYLMAIDRGDGMFENVLSSGPAYMHLLGESDWTMLEPQPIYGSAHRLAKNDALREPAVGSVQYFTLYNNNTPFDGERWALVGIVSEEDLLGFSRQVRAMVLFALSISMGLGLIGIWLAGNFVTKPIVAMAKKVRESDPSNPVKLGKTRITEIDALADSMEYLSLRVAESASRLSQILELAKVPLGAFEYEKARGKVFYTEQLFRIFGIQTEQDGNGIMDIAQIKALLSPLNERVESSEEGGTVSVLRFGEGIESRWVRVKSYEDKTRLLGVASDITQEMLERRKIERERDYDLLTGLYNRRAFSARLEQLFEQPASLRVAALIMLDLDNLKYINDTYGHDVGDDYIRCAANALREHTPHDTLLSRMSGDEFHLLFYGYSDKEQIRGLVKKLHEGMQTTNFALPDGGVLRVRASAGVAWYPEDSRAFDELIKFADFAMYKVKNTTKGEFNEFDPASYKRDSYLLHSKEELNRLIEDQLVDYHFQPIVSTQDGSIYGYEALMRSSVPTLRSPAEILTLAHSQFKLYQIERLTWFKSLNAFSKLSGIAPTAKIFINSIANQVLDEPDILEMEEAYHELLSRVVIELTEEERLGAEVTRRKQDFARRWSAQLALDDFGSGYNGESMLLDLTPEYVKIDMSIVRGIDTDLNRQKILQNLLSYAKGRGIGVVAEGVETRAELETLVHCGVDFLQGYYLARPTPQPGQIPEVVLRELAQARKDYLSGAATV